MRRFLGLLTICWLSLPWVAPATVIPADSCEEDDVIAALALAVDGDTVTVPAGTCEWTSQVVMSSQKGLHLQGAGIDQTRIFDRLSKSSPILTALQLNTAVGKTHRVSGFTFDGSTQLGTGGPGFIQVSGNGETFRIDHNKFYRLKTFAITTTNGSMGVIDSNTFDLAYNNAIRNYHSTWKGVGTAGHNSYAQPHTLGTNQAVYIEDNTFTWTGPTTSIQAAIDPHTGARLVFRYNTVTNGYLASHGTEAQANRAPRQWEVYNNTLSGNTFTNFFIRGGPGVVFNNTSTGYPSGPIIEHYRLFDDGGPPYGICDGRNPYDDNAPGGPFESGTVTSASGYTMTDSSKTWTVGQWAGYSVRNTTLGRSSRINTQGTNTITVAAPSNDPAWSWAVGHTYQIWKANQCLDQAGMGAGDYKTGGGTSTVLPQTWNNAAVEGLYFWNNTLNGSAETIVNRQADWIKAGVHVFTTARPGYTPYTYPHPLRDDTPPPEPEEDDLVAHWRLDESSGTTAFDDSGNTNDGTLTNFPVPAAWVGGKFSRALRFDGVNDYVEIGNIAVANFIADQDFTILLWVKTTTPKVSGQYPIFIQKHSSLATRNDWELYRSTVGDTYFWEGAIRVNNIKYVVRTTQTIADGQWHQIGLQREGDSLRLLQDGRLVDSVSDPAISGDLTNTGAVRLGRSNYSAGQEYYYTGDMDDVRIYDGAIPLNDIRDLYGTSRFKRQGRATWRGGVTIAGD